MTQNIKPQLAKQLNTFLSLCAKRAKDCTPAELKQKREAAGLSIGQAAKMLIIPRFTLEGIENGDLHRSFTLNERLDAVYGTHLDADPNTPAIPIANDNAPAESN